MQFITCTQYLTVLFLNSQKICMTCYSLPSTIPTYEPTKCLSKQTLSKENLFHYHDYQNQILVKTHIVCTLMQLLHPHYRLLSLFTKFNYLLNKMFHAYSKVWMKETTTAIKQTNSSAPTVAVMAIMYFLSKLTNITINYKVLTFLVHIIAVLRIIK